MPQTPKRDIHLVPIETLERLRNLFERVTGVPIVFIDHDGLPVTEVAEPLCFCGSLLHHAVPGTLCLRRKQWDVPEPEVERSLRRERQAGKVLQHRCRGGFRDTAAPIELEGDTIGYAVFGRSLIAEPDLEHFRQLAVEGGMAPEVGDAVARHALVMTPERVAAIGEFLQVITQLVASAAYEALRAQQVLDLERQRDDLIHMIVHDLRTPLTSIIGGLQTVIDTDFDSEITTEFVPMSLDSANVLLEMVNTLLDINKMESGQMSLELAPVQVDSIVEQAIDQVRGLCAEHGHELVAELDETCPVLQADGDKLRRVLINLLGNAIKFTPDGGTLTVGSTCAPGEVRLWVRDTGPGIPAEYRERIFEKFGQVEGEGRKKKNSTGLGLTFCRLVAEAHGGRIWVESEEGKGSTFLLALPLATARPEG